MSRNGGKKKRLFPVILIVIAAVLAVLMSRVQKETEGVKIIGTTYSKKSEGYKILYTWLKQNDVNTSRWERSFKSLPPDASVLVVVEPSIGLERGEFDALETWINQGGVLVLIAFPNSPVVGRFGLEFEERPFKEVLDDEPVTAPPGPFTEGVESLSSDAFLGVSSDDPESIVHIAFSDDAALLVELPIGDGRALVVADPELFDNKNLHIKDHARLADNLIFQTGKNGRVLFDEYHHGYGRVTSIFEYFKDSHLFPIFVQLLLVLFVVWLNWGRRFGSPRPAPDDPRRSVMEYVQALSGLLQRARARKTALKSVLLWMKKEAGANLVDRDERFRRTVQSVEKVLNDPDPPSERELLNAVATLHRSYDEAKSRAPGGS